VDRVKLWILTAKPGRPEWADPWDKARGFVVRAENEYQARSIAAARCGYEGRDAWLDPTASTCKELTPEGEAGLVLRDFLDG
jgi:hypothetical protein